jgi:hypothetical protein
LIYGVPRQRRAPSSPDYRRRVTISYSVLGVGVVSNRAFTTARVLPCLATVVGIRKFSFVIVDATVPLE